VGVYLPLTFTTSSGICGTAVSSLAFCRQMALAYCTVEYCVLARACLGSAGVLGSALNPFELKCSAQVSFALCIWGRVVTAPCACHLLYACGCACELMYLSHAERGCCICPVISGGGQVAVLAGLQCLRHWRLLPR
jgi:hypothetical protein